MTNWREFQLFTIINIPEQQGAAKNLVSLGATNYGRSVGIVFVVKR